MRNILAAFLLELGCLAWCTLLGSARGNVDHYIVKSIAGTSDHGLAGDGSRMLLGAAGLLGHVNRLLLCRRTLISDLTAHRPAARSGVHDHCARRERRYPYYVSCCCSHDLSSFQK